MVYTSSTATGGVDSGSDWCALTAISSLAGRSFDHASDFFRNVGWPLAAMDVFVVVNMSMFANHSAASNGVQDTGH